MRARPVIARVVVVAATECARSFNNRKSSHSRYTVLYSPTPVGHLALGNARQRDDLVTQCAIARMGCTLHYVEEDARDASFDGAVIVVSPGRGLCLVEFLVCVGFFLCQSYTITVYVFTKRL